MKKRIERTGKSKILIVDDHPILRQGLTRLINDQDDLKVCGEAWAVDQALSQVRDLKPDALLVDISLNDSNGLDLIKSVKELSHAVPILVISMHKEAHYAERALRAGAAGYIMKQETPEKVIQALRRVLGGDIYVSEEMNDKLLLHISGKGSPPHSPIETLSDRELEVFRLIGRGHGTRHIADLLHVSVKTVETYRAHIKDKLNLKNAVELSQCAFDWAKSGSEN